MGAGTNAVAGSLFSSLEERVLLPPMRQHDPAVRATMPCIKVFYNLSRPQSYIQALRRQRHGQLQDQNPAASSFCFNDFRPANRGRIDGRGTGLNGGKPPAMPTICPRYRLHRRLRPRWPGGSGNGPSADTVDDPGSSSSASIAAHNATVVSVGYCRRAAPRTNGTNGQRP